MRKIALAFVLLIMVAGGTVSALMTFEMGPFAKTEEELAREAELRSGEDGELASFTGRPFYIEMDPLMIPVFQDNELVGTIQIIYKLQVHGHKNERNVFKLKTKLSDALFKDFTYYIPRTLRKNQNLDISLIKYRVLMVSDRIIGKGVVSDALIQGLSQIAAGS